METVTIEIFSDVLCVWAYGAQARIDQLKHDFGDKVSLRYRFIPLFAATNERIIEGWKARGGVSGFNAHVQEVASSWKHISVHSEIWMENMPASSNSAHLFLKAVQELESRGDISSEPQSEYEGRNLFEELAWRVRCQFFEHNRNISKQSELHKIADGLNLPLLKIHELMRNGEAHAALHLDVEARDNYLIPGSPTLVFNQGRQRLYGNIGYRIIEANLNELLNDEQHGEASWC